MNNLIAHETLDEHPQFCRLSSIDHLRVDLRYASNANFIGRNLYAPLDCAWIRVEAAQGLRQAMAHLHKIAPGSELLVLDALRPQRIQEQMWASLKDSPLSKYLADPAIGSLHSFGMAVDITLVDSANQELDMGSHFDQMDDSSHPEHENRLLLEGKLTHEQVARRVLLRQAMETGGFRGIRTEWWHFDFGDKAKIRSQFPRVG
jgi:zinc D-Ala-D-Ala dipeptidase